MSCRDGTPFFDDGAGARERNSIIIRGHQHKSITTDRLHVFAPQMRRVTPTLSFFRPSKIPPRFVCRASPAMTSYTRQPSGSTPYNNQFRGGRGGYNNRRPRGGGGGYSRGGSGGAGGYRGGFTYRGRSNEISNYHRGGYSQNNNTTPHGDMKTGLYKDSFIEDPWKELIYSRQKQPTATVEVAAGDDEEGEILLPDDDDEGEEEEEDKGLRDEGVRMESVVGLGDGLVEAVRE